MHMSYREEIKFFSRAFYFIIGLLIAITWKLQDTGIMVGALPAIGVVLLLSLLFGRLSITVDGRSLRIVYGYLGIIKKEFPLSQIREARVVDYRPVRQFGGWGIRCGTFEGKKTGCYSMKGSRGVLLILARELRVCVTKTDRVIIESASPEKLRSALVR